MTKKAKSDTCTCTCLSKLWHISTVSMISCLFLILNTSQNHQWNVPNQMNIISVSQQEYIWWDAPALMLSLMLLLIICYVKLANMYLKDSSLFRLLFTLSYFVRQNCCIRMLYTYCFFRLFGPYKQIVI